MRWVKNSDKLSALKFYQNLGFHCTLIEGDENDMDSYKNPSLENLRNITEQDLDNFSGLGIQLGNDSEIRAIDIDDFHIQIERYHDSNLHLYSEYYFVKKCLSLLGLPEDYEWLIRTPHGWHILISAPSFGFEKTSYHARNELKPNIISGNLIHFGSVELLWSGHLVMPPSRYGKYGYYSFYNQQPKRLPRRVGAAEILDFMCFYCGKFSYITELTDYFNRKIIGDAHLFPYYRLNWCAGSCYDEDGPNLECLTENLKFLEACENPTGLNMRGIILVRKDLLNNYKVDKELHTAIKCFRRANDAWGHYNLSCLMAIGAMPGDTNELYSHLELAVGFPEEYKDQLKLLYLANNRSYEEYTIMDISINEDNRIDKMAFLVTDAKGNILFKLFLTSDSCMLENLYNTLKRANYIVGCDLDYIEEKVRHECDICGYSFSYDSTGASSEHGLFTVHLEGYYLDGFNHPKINLPLIQTDEDDPFRRIYLIKNLLVSRLNQ